MKHRPLRAAETAIDHGGVRYAGAVNAAPHANREMVVPSRRQPLTPLSHWKARYRRSLLAKSGDKTGTTLSMQRQRLPTFGLQTGATISTKRISRIVSTIGEKSHVVVNKAEGKYASAHDLRRSYGTRWANRVKPATLQLLMRHKSIETTLKYYVEQDADEIADELWTSFPPGAPVQNGAAKK
jgi:integrase